MTTTDKKSFWFRLQFQVIFPLSSLHCNGSRIYTRYKTLLLRNFKLVKLIWYKQSFAHRIIVVLHSGNSQMLSSLGKYCGHANGGEIHRGIRICNKLHLSVEPSNANRAINGKKELFSFQLSTSPTTRIHLIWTFRSETREDEIKKMNKIKVERKVHIGERSNASRRNSK